MLELLAYIGLDGWQASYGAMSIFTILSAYCLGGYKQRGVAAGIFFLWVINIFYTEVMNDLTPVMFFAIGDFILGSLVLWTARDNWQRGIGVWFVAMMLAHIAFWLQEPKSFIVQYNYWMMFTALGWGQLLHVGTWIYKDIRITFFDSDAKNINMDTDRC